MPLARGRECSWDSVATAAILSVIRARGSWQRAPDKMPAKAISRAGPRPMRLSQYPLNTMKETPAEAEVVSHQLMLRAGLIRRLATGLYSWLPMGLKVLQKVERIIREEMNRAGAFELVMPVIQPAELWQESGRWREYGPELLRIKDRHERDFVAGPTHEEVITDIVRRELQSYRQLPVNFYQIQTKFRDEVRPRFGVMRAREFIMKDAYSFHLDEESLRAGYRAMYDAYTRIFTRTGLTFRAVRADSGAIGGDVSQEFHVLAASGEGRAGAGRDRRRARLRRRGRARVPRVCGSQRTGARRFRVRRQREGYALHGRELGAGREGGRRRGSAQRGRG